MCTTCRTWGANLQGGAIAHRCWDRNDRGLHQSSNYRWERSICARNHHYHISRPHSCTAPIRTSSTYCPCSCLHSTGSCLDRVRGHADMWLLQPVHASSDWLIRYTVLTSHGIYSRWHWHSKVTAILHNTASQVSRAQDQSGSPGRLCSILCRPSTETSASLNE